jgi:hypothetical protein
MHVNLRRYDEHSRGSQSAHDRRSEHGSTLELDPWDAPRTLPGGERDKDERKGPGKIDIRAFGVGADRGLVEISAHARPGRHRVTEKTKTRSASRSTSPIGYAMFVRTTSRLPCVERTTTSTSTEAPSAAATVAARSPSSQRVALKVETRRQSKSTIPT